MKSNVTITWFVKYLGNKEESNRVVRLYNAFGTLPCGFKDMLSLADNEVERKALENLIERKKEIVLLEEDAEYNYRTSPFTDNQLYALEKIYIEKLIKFFPEFKS